MNKEQIGRFRSLYILAMAVIMIGILGVVVVPRVHAKPDSSGDVRIKAGRYVLQVTSAHLHRKAKF